MGKRAKGEGAVYRRSDGRWEAQLRIGIGRRKSVYGRTRREVLGKLREERWKLKRGLPVSSRKLTLAAFLERWLEVTRGRVRESTLESYELNARRVSAELGDLPLSSLNPLLIQATYQHLLRRGLSAYSVLQVHRLLHRALTHAFHLGLVKRNPVLLVYPPRPQRRPQTALSAEQLLFLLDRTRGDRLHPLWVLLSCAGLRIGEALGLRWQDVDLVAGRISVNQALHRRRGAGLVFVEPKTTRSRRAVELTKRAVEALAQHHRCQALQRLLTPGWRDSGLVFTNLKGAAMQPHQANVELTRALRAAGLPLIRVHDLRHTTATVMLEAGIHPKVVQELLGHKTIATTLDTYSHVMPALHGQAVRVLDRWLTDAGTRTAGKASYSYWLGGSVR
jgi:integrase